MTEDKDIVNTEVLKKELDDALLEISNLEEEKAAVTSRYRNYKSIFNETLDVIMITNGKEGKILEINKACISQLGYSPEELIGKHFSSLMEDPDEENNILENTKIFGTVLAAKRIKKKDGSFCFMDLTLNIIDYDKEKVVMTTFRDVSDRVRAELKLRRFSEQLTELNASKDKFFSIIAHDLKSPFTGLLGLSQILCEELDEIGNNYLKKYAEELNNSAKFIFKLLQNLLEWSRLNTGKFDYSPISIDLAKKIDSIVQLLKLNASGKKIDLRFNCAPDITVLADNNMLNSILQNLITNAIKFTREGGFVEISANLNVSSAVVEISVMDNGIGIPEGTLKKIFRVDKNITTLGTAKEKGTGLGLVLCKELVEKNNGTISAISKEGAGTTFTVCLPAVLG